MSDGRVFTGSQALGLKLIDEVGNKKQAIAWLEREKGVRQGPARAGLEAGERQQFRPVVSAAAGVAGAIGLRDCRDRAALARKWRSTAGP